MEKVGLHEAAVTPPPPPMMMKTMEGDGEQRVERQENVPMNESSRELSRKSEEETTVEHGHGVGGRGVVASEDVQDVVPGPADVREPVGAADIRDATIPPPAESYHTPEVPAADEHEHDDTTITETHDEDPTDLPVPRPSSPLSLSRTATLPPRLSLHTERDDGWGDVFSFLPSTSMEGGEVEDATPSTATTAKPNKRMSKRVSISLRDVSLSRSPSSAAGAKSGGGGGIQSRRRSKRFSTTLAIIPPTGQSVNAVVSPGLGAGTWGDSDGETRDVTLDPPLQPPKEGHASGGGGSSSPNAMSPTSVGKTSPSSTYSGDDDQETESHPCLSHSQTKPQTQTQTSSSATYPSTTTSDLLEVGVLTPDAAYPIADSPLWEEVRTLVRQGVSAPAGIVMDRIITTTTTTTKERPEGVEDDLRQEIETHLRDPVSASASAPHDIVSPSEPEPILSMPMSMSPSSASGSLLLPDSPEIVQPSSRFSDASSFQGRSRFSDVTDFMSGPSRFSDATSFQGGPSRFSDATSFQGHSRFSDISVLESAAGGDQGLKSRFSAWSTHRSTAFFSPLEPMPESPLISQMPTKVPAASPTRTNSDLTLPFSVLHTRKLTDLPPPRPPPKDDLPPPPVDAEQEQLYSPDDFRVSRLSSMSNISNAQIHGAKIATLTQANIIPASVLAQMPPGDPSSPSSNVSPPQSTSSKSTAFFSPLSSPQTRPPPLPLPPIGKILPSIVANQRIQEKRRQRTQDSQESSGQQSQESGGERGNGSPAASASASSSSHSRSTSYSVGSAEVFESSFGYEGDPRSLSASATSYEEPLKSPTLPYLKTEGSASPSPSPAVDAVRRDVMQGEREKVQSPGSEDDVPLGYLRMKASQKVQSEVESGWLSDGDGVESEEDRRQDGRRLVLPEHEEAEDTIVVTSGGDSHGVSLPTPSITVNGFNVGDTATLSPPSDHQTHDHAQAQKTLPAVLATTLQDYIYLDFDPREMFTDLQEVAQGQYGSVYAAHVCSGVLGSQDSLVAVKKVPIPVQGTPKIGQLQHELALMSQVRHKHILATDGLFFDFVEDVLWIRMELMERSLADVVVLSEEGLHLEERVIARLTSDASQISFLIYLLVTPFVNLSSH